MRFYTQQLNYFFAWLGREGVLDFAQLTSQIIRKYLFERQKNHEQGGVHCSYRAIRVYLNWTWSEFDFEFSNPIAKVHCENRKPTPIAGIPATCISAVFTACEEGNNTLRNRAMIAILLDTGILRRECFDMKIADVDVKHGVITITRGKNGKPRTAYLGSNARKIVRKYAAELTNFDKNDSFWQSSDGKPLKFSGFISCFRRVITRANLGEQYSFHDLRRCFALEAWRNGADINAVSELLGHSGIEITKRYISTTEQDKRRIHAQVSPLDNLKK